METASRVAAGHVQDAVDGPRVLALGHLGPDVFDAVFIEVIHEELVAHKDAIHIKHERFVRHLVLNDFVFLTTKKQNERHHHLESDDDDDAFWKLAGAPRDLNLPGRTRARRPCLCIRIVNHLKRFNHPPVLLGGRPP
jgi:hypothetical protein